MIATVPNGSTKYDIQYIYSTASLWYLMLFFVSKFLKLRW